MARGWRRWRERGHCMRSVSAGGSGSRYLMERSHAEVWRPSSVSSSSRMTVGAVTDRVGASEECLVLDEMPSQGKDWISLGFHYKLHYIEEKVSVDQLYHRLFCSPNVCPSTKETLSHTLTAPNHLLRDMIAAWRLDHMARSSSNNADTLSIPVEPSEEQIQAILQKFSGHSVMQEQALHEIQLLSKTTKGEQPCLHKCAGLLPGLIDLQKNWKSTWSQELEEQRPGVILNLSVHRPNREILAGANQLPVLLKKIIHKLHKHGSPASHLAKVASIVAILSEFDMFRKRVLDIGGMEMLRDLLRIEDVFVRKEAVTAIRGLCADEEGKINAQSYNVPDALLEYLMRDVHKMEQVKNLEDFKERLRELSSGTLPMQTMLKVDTIINCLSKEFPAPVNP
ncbi:unnamed protein product [Miscanthus lutarioriparius]|uniref:RING-type E3 ubiquitin transferase n=1 Tax=Miscanthus lutarioriparius TaxID=422564 RepID=A0A811Q4Y2_9POAL|nr:unnamed protein product [Miscanthus lutarioriparius]